MFTKFFVLALLAVVALLVFGERIHPSLANAHERLAGAVGRDVGNAVRDLAGALLRFL